MRYIEVLEDKILLDGSQAGVPANLDPVPKTLTFNVSPTPDVNSDRIVNGLDIVDVVSHWGQVLPTGQMANGLVIANIDSHWLESINTIPLDEQTMDIVAQNYITSSPSAFGSAAGALRPIYPPPARL